MAGTSTCQIDTEMEAVGAGDNGKRNSAARISEKTVARMRWYLYALRELEKEGLSVVSSQDIAEKVGVKSGLVRKDLCHFGGFGRPSIGYNIAYLQKKIEEILRVNEIKKVAWVGAQRLAEQPEVMRRFEESNCQVVAVFDADPSKLGLRIAELQVMGTADMEQVIRNLGIEAAVVACQSDDAQWTADRLVAGGVKAILNLTPTILVVPRGVAVRNVDIAGELMMLSYYCGKR